MAKSKYNDDFPLLAEGYARDGLNDIQIAGKLGISETTYYDYQLKYPEFSEAIKKGKAPVDVKVENALLKRALGFDFEEKQSTVKINTDGEAEIKEVKTVKKHIPPDVGAAIFWLTNRKAKDWQNTQKNIITSDDPFSEIAKSIKESKENKNES